MDVTTIVDHVTYEVDAEGLDYPQVRQFFALLELVEMDPSADLLEAGWKVRWFVDANGFQVHLVGVDEEPVALGLSHFAVLVNAALYEGLKKSGWCVRDSGSGRIWLKGPLGIRVEVRPR